MRPTENMAVTKARGRTPTITGYESPNCELCIAKGKQHSGFGGQFLWLLGRPAMRVCRPCAKEMKKVWEGAL